MTFTLSGPMVTVGSALPNPAQENFKKGKKITYFTVAVFFFVKAPSFEAREAHRY